MTTNTTFDPARAAAGEPIELLPDSANGGNIPVLYVGPDPVRLGYVVMTKTGGTQCGVPADRLRMAPKSEVEQLRELVADCLYLTYQHNIYGHGVLEARAIALGVKIKG